MRPTIELLLPDSGAKVILYEKFTHGDYKKIQRSLLESVKVGVDIKDPEKVDISKLPGTLAIDNTELIINLLIKEMLDKDGEKIENTEQFLYDLSIEDGQLLDKKVEETSARSSLTPKDKKK